MRGGTGRSADAPVSASSNRRILTSASCQYGKTDSIPVGQDVRIPETQDAKALLFQKSRPVRVVGNAICLLATVNLNDQLGVGAAEVDDVGFAGNLALPLPSTKPAVSERIPEPGLCIGVLRRMRRARSRGVLFRMVRTFPMQKCWIMAGPLCKRRCGATPHPALSPRASRRGRGESS